MKELIYKLVDVFTFGKGLKRTINGHTLRLPTRFYKYFNADYESENFEFLFKYCPKGGVVMDIGAHIGMFSVIATQVTGKEGKVFAFEPAPSTYELLRKTIKLNKAEEQIKPFQQAVGKEVGKTTFFVSDDQADNSNSLVSYKDDRVLHGIDIEVTTIDDAVKNNNIDKLNFIKIDVEGAEYDTLRGAEKTLSQLKPICIVAIHPEPIKTKGDKLEDIYDFIRSLNYSITYNKQVISKEDFCANKEMIDLHIIPA